jgi:glycosyltransferase involved in cell wall biosynthesis
MDTTHIILPPLIEVNETDLDEKSDSSCIRFIYAGNLGKNKDYIHSAIKAFQIFENKYDFVFNVYGISRDDYIHRYPDVQDFLRDTNKVVFHGKVNRDEVIKSVYESDYFVFTRKKTKANTYGFPTKFAESLSLGTAIITNYTSDLSSHLVKDVTGYVVQDMSNQSMKVVLEEILLKNKRIKISRKHRYSFNYHNYVDDFAEFIKLL